MKDSVLKSAASIEAQSESEDVLSLDEIQRMYGADYRDDNPAVYCGTYYKYNCGNALGGAWLDLTKFADYDDFISVCRQLHADEQDPELMFQDYENFPRKFYSESCMGEETFNHIIEFSELDDEKKEAFKEYLDLGYDCDIKDFNERYEGKFDSEEGFARYIVDETMDLERVMGDLAFYFDYERYAEMLFSTDYTISSGHVFRG